jgi:hypothetical protein
MDLERAAEIFALVNFVVIGLSHLLQSRAWVDLIVGLRSLGTTGVFLNGMLSLMVGSIILALHSSWAGTGAVLTFIGWAQVLKAAVSLMLPRMAMRSLERVSPSRAWEFQAGGAVFLIVSAVIAWGWLPR